MMSMVALLASDALWAALPARAANFNVATESELSNVISVRRAHWALRRASPQSRRLVEGVAWPKKKILPHQRGNILLPTLRPAIFYIACLCCRL
jgi:hypothetical protein